MPFLDGHLNNMIKLHVSKITQTYGQARYAQVKEHDAENNIVRVAYYNPETGEDDIYSGWLPLLIPYIGNGDDTDNPGDGIPWGMVCPPNINQRVIVFAQQGDFNNGLVVGGAYSDISPVPTVDDAHTENGEFLIKHKSGSYIKFFNNGDVTLYADGALNFHSGKDMNIKVGENLTLDVSGGTISTKSKALINKADSTITLDTPLSMVSGDLEVGTSPTGSFSAGNKLVSVVSGIITSIF